MKGISTCYRPDFKFKNLYEECFSLIGDWIRNKSEKCYMPMWLIVSL